MQLNITQKRTAHTLWHEFARSARNARPCAVCDCGVARSEVGVGADVADVAHLFGSLASLPVPAGGDPLASLARVGFEAGVRGEADLWLAEHLRPMGWSVHAVWAMTRGLDLRHSDCDRPECRA